MWLKKILKYKKEELEHIRRKVSLKDVRLKAEDAEKARDFRGAVDVGAGLKPALTKIIAEIKKASPSAGLIRKDFEPTTIAQQYYENGAVALSVLTDEHFFQGSLDHVLQVRRVVPLPILRKDFTFDEYQIYEARGAGADAVLLIVNVLEDSQLKDYQALARELGMAALVEVHDTKELEKALRFQPRLVGINNRNLETLKTELKTTETLAPKIPEGVVCVSESGFSKREDIKRMEKIGIHSFLIGESLLKERDVGKKLRELL